MAIQMRRGALDKLDRSKLLPGEFAICEDGTVVICYATGKTKVVTSLELENARVSADGTVYETLKERLDQEYNQLTKELIGSLNATASALLIGILRNAMYTADQSANITALEAALAMSGSSGDGILYELAEPTTFDGTNSIDTGVALLANDISWSIVGELENLVGGQPIRFFEIGTDKMNEYKFKMEVTVNNAHGIRWSDKTVTCAKLIWLGQKAGNTAKFVITHEAGTNTIKYYGYHTNIAGKTERFDSELVRDNYVALEDTLSICTAGSFRMDTFGIYSRVYTADEITAYLGA